MALSANEDLLRYTAYWLHKKENDWWGTLGHMLGVTWKREQILALVDQKETAKTPTETFIPLAATIQPELIDHLKKVFRVSKGDWIGGGEYVAQVGEKVEELGDLPREEFMKWAASATGHMKQVAQNLEEQQRTVTIKEGQSDNPQIERARQQIAESKKW